MAGLPRTLPELVKKAIAGAMQDVHVALPAQIVRWDNTANLADVQVMVQHPVFDNDNDRSFEDIGNLLGVPVVWPRGGGFILTFPLEQGDSGLLVFNSTAIGEWRATGQSSRPQDASRHSVGWPVFIPGFFPDVSPPSQDPTDIANRELVVVFGKDGGDQQVQIGNAFVDLGRGASDFVALASLVLARLNALKTYLDGHVHTSAASGSPTSAPTVASPTPSSVAATIARAK